MAHLDQIVSSGEIDAFDDKPLRAALHRDPHNPILLKSLALGLIGSERFSEAESVLTQWVENARGDPEPNQLRMNLRHRLAQLAAPGNEQQRLKSLAIADGLQVIELDPSDNLTAQAVVWLCLASGRFDDADRVCRGLLARHPEAVESLYLQARVCHASGEHVESRKLIDRLLAIKPSFVPGLLLRAILHNEAIESAAAIPLLRQVVAEDTSANREARYQLALALGRTGQTEEAKSIMAAVQLDNLDKYMSPSGEMNCLPLEVRRAELLMAGGRDEDALRPLNSVLGIDPNHSAAHQLVASVYESQGDSARAEEHRRRANSGPARP